MAEQFIFPPEKLVGDFRDFIGVWDGFMPKEMCDDIIRKCLEARHNNGWMNVDNGSTQFPSAKLGRSDFQYLFNEHESHLSNQVREYLKCCVSSYVIEYAALKPTKMVTNIIKFQLTPPRGGYHEWHYETSSYFAASRELVWTIYLNDMPDGEAETEFIYQKRRIQPKKGRIVIWPAGFTHTHRGNTVFSQDKYILTGWIHKTV